MTRPHQNGIAAEKENEIRQKMSEVTKKFNQDLKDLEMAKREYSAECVSSMDSEFERLLPPEVLNMKMSDFVKGMEEQQQYEEDETEQVTSQAGGKTPTTSMPHPSYFKSMKLTDGLHMKIPSCITPRVNGKLNKPRPSKYGEILFSVRGTPVMNTVTAANQLDAKKQDAIVQNLMHQEDAMMTPETRKIIGKLKELVQKKARGDESD